MFRHEGDGLGGQSADLRAANTVDLFTISQGDGRIVLFGDEPGERCTIVQRNFVGFVAFGYLFGGIDERLGELSGGEPSRDTREVRPKNSSFATGRETAAVA